MGKKSRNDVDAFRFKREKKNGKRRLEYVSSLSPRDIVMQSFRENNNSNNKSKTL